MANKKTVKKSNYKKKISKKSKRRLVLFGTISVFIVGYFVYCAFDYAINIIKLDSSEKKLINKLDTLKGTEEDLKLEIQKLKDLDYLARYARENYLYSKDGEYIIRIEPINNFNSINQISTINYKIIGGITCGSLLVVIIIVNRKKKLNKK